ncbi:uncharacterized protein PODANS_6_7290 [Podospora anserina S mat+]|uniref:Podospora anserina S mat+ genomic DNA chromosome 6, supercontig 2 n=1 Tax=Podospora anserina (strain S / ATCC MYA-4624 / DSM 980 / FGSC 10383) TaxID=515849 RepID=B2B3U2_PODAN|nr:uncharacterized protein PODANS_6_7290 [Podospora anserina S mat+]CAP71778.1 unnamed protein product [Podospora anserina S mat+]CDP31169.1 Putative protein of unknown function [Podospora anserina S mat+]
MSVDPTPWTAECGTKNGCNMVIARFASAQCEGLAGDEGKKALVMFGDLTFTRDDSLPKSISDCWDKGDMIRPFQSKLHKSTLFLCRPPYDIKNISLVRNGTKIIETADLEEPEAQRTLSTIKPLDLLSTLLKSFETNHLELAYRMHGHVIEVGGSNISVDKVMGTLLLYRHGLHQSQKALELYDGHVIKRAAAEFYRQFGAMLGKLLLLEPASISSFWSLSINDDHLVIRAWAAHWMTGLTATCIALCAVLIFLLPKGRILPCNPTSLAGMAALVSHSQDLVERLKFSAAARDKALERRLHDTSFKPVVIDGAGSGCERFVIPVGHLGDPDKIGEVAEAIKYQYGIIQAQYLAVQLVPAGETNVTLSGGGWGRSGLGWGGTGEGAGEGYEVLVGVGGCG